MNHHLAKGLAKAGIPGARKHLFVCLGPDCCRYREGELLWDAIKRRVKASHLPVMRTKAGCFRICKDGPLLVVYPDGVWYARVTPARFERIFAQHIVGGQPVKEWVIAKNDLGCGLSCGGMPDGAGESPEGGDTELASPDEAR